ncbi:DUF5655 domain-containing protein [Sphingobacterium lactis]|uniref:DUF5655 domain-containing protein n=1 Tax=Sphingobacterium lactis TaxID=797291 RepID=UPI003F7E7A39
MSQIAQLTLIKSEFSIKHNRIDTLAFDQENKAFVIIEYKRSQSYSVVDQGISYLNLMLDYKADFIIEYNETQSKVLKRNDLDWSQSKVMFVSTSFTEVQKQSTNFKDLAIELWEIKQYENDIVLINPIKKTKSAPNIKQVQGVSDSEIAKVTREIKVFTEDDHLKDKSDDVVELYEAYKQAIVNLVPDVDIEAKKLYIAFKKNKNIVDIVVLKNSLKLFINCKSGDLDDSKDLMRDVSAVGHWGNGDYEVVVADTKDLEYIMSLIKQAI